MRIVGTLAAALLLASSVVATPALAQNNSAQGSTDKAQGSTDNNGSNNDNSVTQNTKKLKPMDRKFLTTAYDHEYEELAVGTLAAHQGKSEQVKTLGSRIMTEESGALSRLRQLAQKDNLTLPTKPSPGLMDALPRLEKLSGAQFDNTFLAHVRANDQVALSSFQQEAKYGNDHDLKSLANEEAPVIKGQLDQVKAGVTEMQKGSSPGNHGQTPSK